MKVSVDFESDSWAALGGCPTSISAYPTPTHEKIAACSYYTVSISPLQFMHIFQLRNGWTNHHDILRGENIDPQVLYKVQQHWIHAHIWHKQLGYLWTLKKSDFQSFPGIGMIYEAVSERGKRFQHKFYAHFACGHDCGQCSERRRKVPNHSIHHVSAELLEQIRDNFPETLKITFFQCPKVTQLFMPYMGMYPVLLYFIQNLRVYIFTS